MMEATYTPVAYEYREVIEAEITKKTEGKVFYFCQEETICTAIGKITKMEEVAGKGIFIYMEPESSIRIDRIITLFGKPGAAYDEYDAYANACMDCSGGYTKEELDEM